jgi:hypothetical protein
MVVGPLAMAIACGGRSERLIGDGEDTGGDAGAHDTGGSAGRGSGGSSARGGTAGSEALGGQGGKGGPSPGKGGAAGFGAFGGFAGKAPLAGSSGAGFGGGSGFGGFGGGSGFGGFGGGSGFGGGNGACSPNPCLNGGVCIGSSSGELGCECPAGFSGPRCEAASEPCPLSPCLHGGTCVMTTDGAACDCPPDWQGTSCECRAGDEPVAGGCRLTDVCGHAAPATYGGGNCSSNTSEFADWWCQLAGYDGSESYDIVTTGFHEALFYRGLERQVLSECSQVEHVAEYSYSASCAGVSDVVCAPAPLGQALRQKILVCGGAQRSVASFLPAGSSLIVEEGCEPDETTQAVLVSRNGTSSVASTLRAYLHAGGIMLSEYSNSDELFSLVFTDVASGTHAGSCNDNAPTTVGFNPTDRFWLDNPFQSTPLEFTGCGFDVYGFPFLVALGGWSPWQVGLGYRNLGRGRFWATDFDWSDNDSGQTDYTRRLLGYMITHRR